MKKKWYLVRVDTKMSARDPLSQVFATSGVYYVEFLTKCSYDTRKSDSPSRWWVKWHGFTTLSNGDIDLEPCRTEFRPNRTANLVQFTPFGDTVNLLDLSLYMLGPFEYLQPRTTRAARYTVHNCLPLSIWQQLFDLCPYFGVAVPSMFPPSHSSIAFSPVHLHSHAPTSASIVIMQSPYLGPSNDQHYDPFSSQLSRLHWLYSRVRAYLFPHFEEGSMRSLDPLSLVRFWNLCYFYYIVGSFFQFWTM